MTAAASKHAGAVRRRPSVRSQRPLLRLAPALHPAPEHPIRGLQLAPRHWERPSAYVCSEDFRCLRDVSSRYPALLRALQAGLTVRGLDLPGVAVAQLLALFAFRTSQTPSPGLQLSNAMFGEALSYCERQLQRGWSLLLEMKLIERHERLVPVLELGLSDEKSGELHDGFEDANGKLHLLVQLPSVTYLALKARQQLEAVVAELRGEARDQFQAFSAAVAPTLRVLERRLGRSGPSPAAGPRLVPAEEVLEVTPSPTHLIDSPIEGANTSTASASAQTLHLPIELPANAKDLLTDEGSADGLRWEGGSLDSFAHLVRSARSVPLWVRQRRQDRLYVCTPDCGLQQRERDGRERRSDTHHPGCRLVGSTHPTGQRIQLVAVATRSEDLLGVGSRSLLCAALARSTRVRPLNGAPECLCELSWQQLPAPVRERLDDLLIDVLIEASRQELRDFDLRNGRSAPERNAPALPALVLPPHTVSRRSRRREYLLNRGQQQLELWRRRLASRRVAAPSSSPRA